jgi:hypothetical protein
LATTIVIREYGGIAETKVGQATVNTVGALLTDIKGQPIKSIVAGAGAADCAQLHSSCHWVQLENKGVATVRYAIRPKGMTTPVFATPFHPPITAGATVVEQVSPGTFISFVEAP